MYCIGVNFFFRRCVALLFPFSLYIFSIITILSMTFELKQTLAINGNIFTIYIEVLSFAST